MSSWKKRLWVPVLFISLWALVPHLLGPAGLPVAVVLMMAFGGSWIYVIDGIDEKPLWGKEEKHE